MDWLSDWIERTSYPYVLLDDDRQDSVVSEQAPELKSPWRRLVREVREPGTILSAMLPTMTGGFATISIAWALVTSAPLSIALGTLGGLLGVVTVRLFAILD